MGEYCNTCMDRSNARKSEFSATSSCFFVSYASTCKRTLDHLGPYISSLWKALVKPTITDIDNKTNWVMSCLSVRFCSRIVKRVSYNHLIKITIRFLGIPSAPLSSLLLLRVKWRYTVTETPMAWYLYERNAYGSFRISCIQSQFIITIISFQ